MPGTSDTDSRLPDHHTAHPRPAVARPLSARSVILSTLLGSDPPRLDVARLVRVTALFGIGAGATRTALSRMVAHGELDAPGDGHYRLAGALVTRQQRQRQSRAADTVEWNGRWRVAVVAAAARPGPERAALRRAAQQLRLAAQRDGVWMRPDNLDPARLPDLRAVVDEQCRWWSAHPDADDAELAAALWDLDGWSATATALRRDLHRVGERLDAGDLDALAEGFVLSAAVLRHFQADPLLPPELLDRRWPGPALRRDYEHYDAAYRALLARWFAADDVGS